MESTKHETPQHLEFEKTLFVKSPHKYLSEVLDDLPDNVYLNKTSTGCGATTICLKNSINYIVIVPYISAIKNKVDQHTNILGVYGGVTEDDIKDYILNAKHNNLVQKLITTYDSFYKIYNVLQELGLLKEFKLAIDEAHVLVSLAKIKGVCFNFLYKHYKEFKSYVFITATPNNKTLLPTAIRDVEFVRVVWEISERVKITEQRVKDLKECNKFVIEICKRHLLGEEEGNAYIFYNSVNEIVSVIQKLKKMEDFTSNNVNIFCAENPHNDKKISLKLGREFLGGSFKDCKTINFLSSANYESCDIYDPNGMTYIIVSSKRNSTALTNHILVPQICGRLRNSQYKFEVKMIVSGFDKDIYNQPLDHFNASLDTLALTSKHLIERANHSRERGFEQAYMKDLDSFSTDPFIIVNTDNTIEFNEGAMLSEIQTYQAFNSHIVSLPDVNTEIANTVRVLDNQMLTVSDMSRYLVDEKVDFGRMMKTYVTAIEDDDIGVVEMIEQRSNEHKEYVEVLGISRVKAIGFNKTKLTYAYNLQLKFNDNTLLIKSNIRGLRVNERYSLTYIQQVLQQAYDKVQLQKKAKSSDIQNYFNVKKVQVLCHEDGKRKQGFLILSDSYKDEEF